MKAQEFLISKGIVSVVEQRGVHTIQKWLEEYANIVLNIAAEKAKIEDIYPRYVENIYGELEHYKVNVDSILNCLKD